MSLVVFGTNHKSAKLEVRERWAYGFNEIPDVLKSIRNDLAISEVVLLSTCNRTEIYCDIENPDDLINWFNKAIKPSTTLDLATHGFMYHGQQAVIHLMRVASGLDSMVLGEPQILGQFKQAYQIAKDAKTVGKKFDKLFDQVFSVAKSVRANTDIGAHPISVASASVNLLLNELGVNDCLDLNILLIGSGDTIRIIAETLISKNIKNISLTNRTKSNAQELADSLNKALAEHPDNNTKIIVHDFDIIERAELPENLATLKTFDVVFSATQSQNYILNHHTVEKIINSDQSRQLVLIDLAVPRDIDPKCIDLPHTCLYTIDDLDLILQHNTQLRHKSALEAEKIIKQYANDFFAWERSLFVLSSICQYRQQADAMCADVMEKAKRKLDAGQDPEEVLISALELLRNRLMHHPTVTLKSLAEQEKISEVELLKDFLNL